MNYFEPWASMNNDNPYGEFVAVNRKGERTALGEHWLLPFQYISQNETLLDRMETHLNFDYYGLVYVSPAQWKSFADDSSMEAPTEEKAQELLQELQELQEEYTEMLAIIQEISPWAESTLAELGEFCLRGL